MRTLRRWAIKAKGLAAQTPMEFVAVATTGFKPKATRIGKVKDDAPPAIPLIMPTMSPAKAIISTFTR